MPHVTEINIAHHKCCIGLIDNGLTAYEAYLFASAWYYAMSPVTFVELFGQAAEGDG